MNLSEEELFNQLKISAQSGNTDAMYRLAFAYKDGTGTEANNEQFFAWMEKAAEAGHAAAMYNLALAYEKGTGTEANNEQFFAWIEKAAEAGDTDAMYSLALAYRDGTGTEANNEQYFAWMEKAVEAGDTDAMSSLAFAYKDGTGTEANNEQFFAWMEKAVEAGHAAAMYNLALAYEKGTGTEANNEQFFAWMEKAVEAGDTDAMYSLALAYRDGTGTEANNEQYFAWMEKAAEAGDTDAMGSLSFAYKDGTGTEASIEQFFAWMEKAAEAGHATAMYNLALAYLKGTGTEANKEQYFAWMEKAAEAGDTDAMYYLALAYKGGIGTEANNEQYFAWTGKAAEAGHATAMYNLALAYRDGTGTETSIGQYFAWMEKAASANLNMAKFNIADAYVKGLGCDYDIDKARQWFQDAVDDGNTKAFVGLGVTKLAKEHKISAEKTSAILDAFISLYDKVKTIRESHLVKPDDAKDGVAHFTTFDAITNMLPAQEKDKSNNCLRLYNIAYVNDPQEGQRLIDAECNNGPNPLKEFFDEKTDDLTQHTYIWEGHEISIYSASFTLGIDRLDLWRAYGEDGNGYCIITPIEAFEQKRDNDTLISSAVQWQKSELSPSPPEKNTPTKIEPADDSVLSVLYHMKYTDEDVTKTLGELQSPLETLTDIKKELSGGKELFDEIARMIVSDIQYLYKNMEYINEKEARMVGAFSMYSISLMLDSNDPQKIFAETKPLLFAKQKSTIIIGPKVKDAVAANMNMKYRLAKHGFLSTTNVRISNVGYR